MRVKEAADWGGKSLNIWITTNTVCVNWWEVSRMFSLINTSSFSLIRPQKHKRNNSVGGTCWCLCWILDHVASWMFSWWILVFDGKWCLLDTLGVSWCVKIYSNKTPKTHQHWAKKNHQHNLTNTSKHQHTLTFSSKHHYSLPFSNKHHQALTFCSKHHYSLTFSNTHINILQHHKSTLTNILQHHQTLLLTNNFQQTPTHTNTISNKHRQSTLTNILQQTPSVNTL